MNESNFADEKYPFMEIIIKNVPLFKSLIRVFEDCEFVTFKIIESKLLLTGVFINVYYAEIDEKCVEFHNYEEIEFTVTCLAVLNALQIFKNQLVLSLDDNLLVLQSNSQRTESRARIPLNCLVNTFLNTITDIDAIFTVNVSDIHILRNFKKTHYFISETVSITQNVPGGKEEAVIKAELLESGIIDFKCDNQWFFKIYHLRKNVNEYIFVFSDRICQISLNIEPSLGINLIIQNPKLLED